MAASSHSALLKREIEAKLASRIPGALSPPAQQAPRLISSGVPQIDALLGGGLPIGGISEFTGMASSGRTSLALALLAEATIDAACAYVDVEDSVDPRSAAAAGACLRNLLWVRVASLQPSLASMAAREAPAAHPVELPVGRVKVGGQGCGSHHPRTETKGLDSALNRMLAQKAEARLDKMEGTPGCPNRPLSLAAASDEQIRFDHFNARKADEADPIRQADKRAAIEARQRAQAAVPLRSPMQKQEKPWTRWSRLDKAIRVTDQILQSGGFRVVVLDLASTSAEQALRIPSATWFRFRRAAQESDAILLLLSQAACARSSALCVLDCSPGLADTSNNLLTGLSRTAEIARQRLGGSPGKKAPGRAVTWEAIPDWMRAAGR
jgi:recombination protein RecA